MVGQDDSGASERKLTPQQELFVREYLKDCNATQAALRAGYAESGAGTEGHRLLKNAEIWRRITGLLEEKFRRVEIEADQILRELGRMGFSDPREIYDEHGAVRPPKDWPEDLARAVAGIEVNEEFDYFDRGGMICDDCGKIAHRRLIGYTKKIKFWPKDRGLELLGKHKKLFTDKVEHSGKVTLEELVAGPGKTNEEKHD